MTLDRRAFRRSRCPGQSIRPRGSPSARKGAVRWDRRGRPGPLRSSPSGATRPVAPGGIRVSERQVAGRALPRRRDSAAVEPPAGATADRTGPPARPPAGAVGRLSRRSRAPAAGFARRCPAWATGHSGGARDPARSHPPRWRPRSLRESARHLAPRGSAEARGSESARGQGQEKAAAALASSPWYTVKSLRITDHEDPLRYSVRAVRRPRRSVCRRGGARRPERRPVRLRRRPAADLGARQLLAEHHHTRLRVRRRGHRRIRRAAPPGRRLRRHLTPAAQAIIAAEDADFDRHFGLSISRDRRHAHARRHRRNSRHAGWALVASGRREHAHAAARAQPVSRSRRLPDRRRQPRAEDQGSDRRDPDREALHEARNPDALRQPDALRPRHVRRRKRRRACISPSRRRTCRSRRRRCSPASSSRRHGRARS